MSMTPYLHLIGVWGYQQSAGGEKLKEPQSTSMASLHKKYWNRHKWLQLKIKYTSHIHVNVIHLRRRDSQIGQTVTDRSNKNAQ